METSNQRKNFNADKLASIFKSGIFNLKNFNKIIFFLIIVLGVYYLAGINDLAVKGFDLSDLKQRRNKLAAENNKLELVAMTLSSYGAISEKISGLKMVAVGNVDYLDAGAGAVAKK